MSVDLDLPGTIWSSHPLTHVVQGCAAAMSGHAAEGTAHTWFNFRRMGSARSFAFSR